MPPDITPGGNATLKDAGIRIPDRETNLANFTRVVGLVEMESTRLKNRPDSSLRISTEPGTYWTIQTQRGLLSGLDPNTPSFSATLSPRSKDGLPPFESIQAHAITMFGKTGIVGIHMYPRSGERTWDEQTDIARIAGLVDAYFVPKPTATEKAVAWAAKVSREELGEISEARIRKHIVSVDQGSDKVMIRELNKKNGTRRLIMSDPGAPETSDGTPARPARIIVQDLDRGVIILEQKTTRRILRKTLRRIFPNYTDRPTINNTSFI